MERLRSKSIVHLIRAAEDIHAAQRLLKARAGRFLRESKPGTLRLPRRLPLVLLKELLRQWWIREARDLADRFDRAFLDRLLDLVHQNRCGRKIEIAGKTIVRTSDGLRLLLPEDPAEPFEAPVFPGAVVRFKDRDYFCLTEPDATADEGLWVPPGHASNLTWRTRKTGDHFRPATGGGGKKLNRWLIDRKIPAGERDALLLLVSGSDVLWIPGYERSALTSPSRKKGFWFIGRRNARP